MGNTEHKRHAARARVEIRAGGHKLTASHGYVSSYEPYQAPALEAAGALGGIFDGRSWRMLLLGGAAAGALTFGVSRTGHAAPDACSAQAGGARTCTGNQSAGISYNAEAGLTTLNVNNLTQNIAPAADTDGIYFNAEGAATVTSDTGAFNITTTGAGDGIDVRTPVIGTNAVNISHTGDITTENGDAISARTAGGGITVTTNSVISARRGISARSTGTGAIMVTHTGGTITSVGDSIYANSAGGNITVNATGNLTSSGGRGIFARTEGFATVSVTHTGDITGSTGVRIYSENGAITLSTDGTITSDVRSGIQATNDGIGAIMVTHTGDVSANATGVLTISEGGGITISTTGNITSTTARGISARDRGDAASGGENVSVTHTGGDIMAATDGVYAYLADQFASVTVNTTGQITGTAGFGIFARDADFQGGGASVTHTGGSITAGTVGVTARAVTGAVGADITGDITAGTRGVYASTSSGAINVSVAGDIMAGTEGVFARSSTGADVTVTTTGNVTSTGNRGIYAQTGGANAVSVTHSGGNITSGLTGIEASSAGGGVTIASTGGITASAGSGISATDTAGNIGITTGGGTVTGPTAGVSFAGGGVNTLTNQAGGTITSAGTAVLGTTGGETVDNSGTITGIVDLGGGANAFNNLAGAAFNSGATANIGAGNALTNSGNHSPGGVGVVQTTALTGNQVQNAGGTMTMDINTSGASDLVTVTGTANLAGTVTLNILSISQGANQDVVIQTSGGGNTDSGLTLAPGALPAGVQATLAVNPNDVTITFNVNQLANFDTSNLTPNQRATLTSIVNAVNNGIGGAQALADAIAALPAGQLGDALDQLSPEGLGNLDFSTLLASLGFTDNTFSCKSSDGSHAFIRETGCAWLRPAGRRFSQDRERDGSNLGFSEGSFGVSAGAQAALDLEKTWVVGIAAGYERVNFESNAGRTIITGDRLQAGVVLKHTMGPLLLGAGVTGGYGLFDSTRTISFTGFNGTAKGDFDSVFVTGRLRAAYLFEGPSSKTRHGKQADWYVKPAVDLDLTWLKRSGFTETGAGGANLAIDSESKVTLSISPSLEIGGEFEAGTAKVRPFLKVGAQIFSNTDNDVTARFAAAPGSTNFTTTSTTDRVFGTVSAGVDVVHEKSLSLKLQYDGKFGASSRSHAIGAKLSWRF